MVTFDPTLYPRLCRAEQQVYGFALYMSQGIFPSGVTAPSSVPIDTDCATDPEVLAYFLGVPSRAVEKVLGMLEEKGAIRE